MRLRAEIVLLDDWGYRRHTLRPSKPRMLGKAKADVQTMLSKS